VVNVFHGLAASPGIAIGHALVYLARSRTSSDQALRAAPSDPENEWRRLLEALHSAAKQLDHVRGKAVQEIREEEAAVFLAHQEFLSDPDLLQHVDARVHDRRQLAEEAVHVAFEGCAAQLEALDDEYYRERALDLRDVAGRLERLLSGANCPASMLELESPTIVVAHDPTPSDTAQMNKQPLLGFCTAPGGLTSHTAIIARVNSTSRSRSQARQDLRTMIVM
jgi:phosphotransferase system enzyme I (PtsI)